MTFKIKPLEIIRFNYDVHDVKDLTERHHRESHRVEPEHRVVDHRRRHRDSDAQSARTELKHEWLGDARRFGWSFLARLHRSRTARPPRRARLSAPIKERLGSGLELGFYRLLSAGGGFTLHGSGQDDQLLEDAAVGPICLHLLGISARRLREEPEGLREVGRGLLQGDRIPLQHAARVVLHQEGHQLAAVVHATTATSSRSTRFTRRARRRQAAWATFLQAFNDWAHRARRHPLAESEPVRQKEHVVPRTATGGRSWAIGSGRWTRTGEWSTSSSPSCSLSDGAGWPGQFSVVFTNASGL